jgi:hypothetical protein
VPIPTIRVIPRDGFRVRDPETGLVVPAEGITALRGSHWLRQESDGAVDLEPLVTNRNAPKRGAKKTTQTATPAPADAEKG